MMQPASTVRSDELGAVADDNRGVEYNFGDVPPLVLPFSRRPDPEIPFQPAAVPVTLSAETAERLRSLASDPALAFFAAWCVLLWRFTDQSEVVVGFLANDPGRRRSRTYLLRVSFTESLSFSNVMQQLNEARE